MTNDIIERRDENNQIFLYIDKNKKQGYYKINPESSQYKYCEEVILSGFTNLPSGFYKDNGMGMTNSASYLFKELFKKYNKKIKIILIPFGENKLDGRGSKVTLTLSHADLSRLNKKVRIIKNKKNKEITNTIKQFLGRHFVNQFRDFRKLKSEYMPGMLAQIMELEGFIKNLNDVDRAKLEEFIPEYLSSIEGTIKSKRKLKIIFESLDAGKKVYFEKIIKEFRKKLNRKAQNEGDWQKFLSKHILILRNTYAQVLEKENVSLEGKFPDFMLIDPYSYLDIYEIKKPNTNLLKYDKDRNNYYWDPEISKAISQVENYLHQVQKNSDALINEIRRNKGIDVNIVRPRGYIIAGQRQQLKNEKMIDDFRILNESLKNIDLILYDDLLNNLEAFVKRVEVRK